MLLPPALAIGLQKLGAAASLIMPPPPALRLLTRVQAEAREGIQEEWQQPIAAVQALYREARPETADRELACAQLAKLAETLVAELRTRVAAAAIGHGSWSSRIARLDAQLPVETAEFMDEASMDETSRLKLMRTLDQRTQRAGGYVHFLSILQPLLGESRSGTVVLDVATGHAGFPVALAQLTRDRGHLRIIASDVRPEYLEIGRRHAQDAGVDDLIDFRVVDALSLSSSFRPGEVDIITCTQSLHHFGAGGVALLLAEAIRHARRGIVFVDLVRSFSRLLMIGMDAATSFSWPYFHDAVVSVRKSFLPEELRLIAACVPGGETLEAFYLHPAFVVLRTAPRSPSQP